MKDSKEVQPENASDPIIGDIVAGDYRTARVFEKHGIDFCCGGNVSLASACANNGIDFAAITEELKAVIKEPIERSQNYASWEMLFLADYIVNTHHIYIKENIGQIAAYAHKIADVHGARHPEVIEIAAIFDRIKDDMEIHLREEEEVFFPAIKRVDAARKTGAVPEAEDIKAIQRSLPKLRQEHDEVGNAVHEIHRLSGNYAIPEDVCNTFAVTYRQLKEFEDDLHKHVHLENNILFVKAAGL